MIGNDASTGEVFVPNREVLDELRAYERSKDLLRDVGPRWSKFAG